MGDDFKVGDVVVCVDAGADIFDQRAPQLLREKHTYRVATTGEYRGIFCVGFRDFKSVTPGHVWAWNAKRFRKLPKADDSFINQLRALTPKEDNHA